MPLTLGGLRDRLSMSCSTEIGAATPTRKAAHHRECVRPDRCTCLAHEHDAGYDADRDTK